MTLFTSYAATRPATGLGRFAASMRRAAASLLSVAAVATGLAGGVAEAAIVIPVNIGQPDTAALLLTGQIMQGDLGRLQAAVSKVPTGKKIVLLLESPGGSVDEGLAIGRFVYASKITTIAIEGPGCASACSFIFLAGRDSSGKAMRIMMSGARVGMHHVRVTPNAQVSGAEAAEMQTVAQLGIAKLEAFFRELSIPGEFLSMTLAAPANSMNWLREFDALRLGIFVMDPSTGRLITPDVFKRQTAMR